MDDDWARVGGFCGNWDKKRWDKNTIESGTRMDAWVWDEVFSLHECGKVPCCVFLRERKRDGRWVDERFVWEYSCLKGDLGGMLRVQGSIQVRGRGVSGSSGGGDGGGGGAGGGSFGMVGTGGVGGTGVRRRKWLRPVGGLMGRGGSGGRKGKVERVIGTTCLLMMLCGVMIWSRTMWRGGRLKGRGEMVVGGGEALRVYVEENNVDGNDRDEDLLRAKYGVCDLVFTDSEEGGAFCQRSLGSDSIVYSLGISQNLSFEGYVAETLRAKVYLFDERIDDEELSSVVRFQENPALDRHHFHFAPAPVRFEDPNTIVDIQNTFKHPQVDFIKVNYLPPPLEKNNLLPVLLQPASLYLSPSCSLPTNPLFPLFSPLPQYKKTKQVRCLTEKCNLPSYDWLKRINVNQILFTSNDIIPEQWLRPHLDKVGYHIVWVSGE